MAPVYPSFSVSVHCSSATSLSFCPLHSQSFCIYYSLCLWCSSLVSQWPCPCHLHSGWTASSLEGTTLPSEAEEPLPHALVIHALSQTVSFSSQHLLLFEITCFCVHYILLTLQHKLHTNRNFACLVRPGPRRMSGT